MVTLDGLARARHLVPPSYLLPLGDTLPQVHVRSPHTTAAQAGMRLCVRAAAPLLVPRGAGCGGGRGKQPSGCACLPALRRMLGQAMAGRRPRGASAYMVMIRSAAIGPVH